VNLLVLYLQLLKASVTSFSGLGSLPMVRSANDFWVMLVTRLAEPKKLTRVVM